MFDLGIYYCNR